MANNFTLQDVHGYSLADAGFPIGGHSVILQIFFRKLHKNETMWTEKRDCKFGTKYLS